jgi:hypothetical protein
VTGRKGGKGKMEGKMKILHSSSMGEKIIGITGKDFSPQMFFATLCFLRMLVVVVESIYRSFLSSS